MTRDRLSNFRLFNESSAHLFPNMASTPARPGQPADNALSRRMFTVALHEPASSSSAASAPPTRQLKRIHLAAEILRARKICAGDALVVMPRPEEGSPELDQQLNQLSLRNTEVRARVRKRDRAVKAYIACPSQSLPDKKKARFAVGVAWPSFTLPGTG